MLLKVLGFFLPLYKKKKFLELFALTAAAFQCEMPALRGLSFRECLTKYALFTKEQAEKAIREGENLAETRRRLYDNAWQMGWSLRKVWHIAAPEEVIAASRLIYQVLGINYAGNTRGEVVIDKCFFSAYYTGEVCRVISALDEGLATGLSAGGRLCFRHRITEGHDACLAYFEMKGDAS